MYNVKDYSVVYNNAVCPVIYVRVLLTYGKPHHFTKREGRPIKLDGLILFLSTIFLLHLRNCPDIVVYFCHFFFNLPFPPSNQTTKNINNTEPKILRMFCIDYNKYVTFKYNPQNVLSFK